MSSEQMLVGIVTHNSEDVIEPCIKSILASQRRVQILIVDTDSSDNTVKKIRAMKGPIQLMINADNYGLGHANNQILNYAAKRNNAYVLLLNPDTVLSVGCIPALIQGAKENNNRALIGGIEESMDKERKYAGGRLDPVRRSAALINYAPAMMKTSIDYISGSCILIPQSVISRNIRFYESYFMYYEDVELSQRALKQGFKLVIADKARYLHYEKSRHKSYERIKNYYLARNHLLYVLRNESIVSLLREFIRLPKTLWQERKKPEGVHGIIDFCRARFGAYGKN